MKHQIILIVFSCFISIEYILGATSICPKDNGFFSNPMDCSEFYVCKSGVPSMKKCPSGYHFNPAHAICDIPAQAKCPNICQSKSGAFPHPADCKKYYHCDHGRANLMACPGRLNFNPALKVCDFSYRAGCIKTRS